MTDREALGEILASVWWSGYRKVAPVDAGKVEAEYRGERRPRPSSRFARALVAIARNNPPQPPTPASVFVQTGGFLRTPDGNAETKARDARARGYRWAACNTGNHPAGWDTIRSYDTAWFRVVNWARCRTADDVVRLAQSGLRFVVNLEDEAKDILPPARVKWLVDNYNPDADWAVSTNGWLFNDVDWTPFQDRPVLLQMFTGEVPVLRGQLDACVQHARDLGLRVVLPTWQAFATGGVRPAPEPWDGAFSLYCFDDVADWGMYQ